ncbi:hypothetical protein GCM10027414_29400 [Humibacter ginsengiterrae]
MVLLAIGACLTVSLVATGGLSRVSEAMTPAPECPRVPPVTVGSIVVPAGPVAGFCQPELVMAAHIMNAAHDQGIGTHTQAVGVMTAIGESGLRNLDHGDTAGPDSRGLFQQRDNGAWGTLADRMDPYTAATHFFDKLTSIDGWQTMDPSELAHRVQGNSDAGYYSQFWAKAQAIVTALQPQ